MISDYCVKLGTGKPKVFKNGTYMKDAHVKSVKFGKTKIASFGKTVSVLNGTVNVQIITDTGEMISGVPLCSD